MLDNFRFNAKYCMWKLPEIIWSFEWCYFLPERINFFPLRAESDHLNLIRDRIYLNLGFSLCEGWPFFQFLLLGSGILTKSWIFFQALSSSPGLNSSFCPFCPDKTSAQLLSFEATTFDSASLQFGAPAFKSQLSDRKSSGHMLDLPCCFSAL